MNKKRFFTTFFIVLLIVLLLLLLYFFVFRKTKTEEVVVVEPEEKQEVLLVHFSKSYHDDLLYQIRPINFGSGAWHLHNDSPDVNEYEVQQTISDIAEYLEVESWQIRNYVKVNFYDNMNNFLYSTELENYVSVYAETGFMIDKNHREELYPISYFDYDLIDFNGDVFKIEFVFDSPDNDKIVRSEKISFSETSSHVLVFKPISSEIIYV